MVDVCRWDYYIVDSEEHMCPESDGASKKEMSQSADICSRQGFSGPYFVCHDKLCPFSAFLD